MKVILIGIFSFDCVGCGLLPDPTPEELYKEFMNMDVPSTLDKFEGEGKIVFPVFMCRGYFIYEADDAYFEMLASFDSFADSSTYNHEFIERPFYSHEIDSLHLQFWLKDTKLENSITLENKRTYAGTNFPYIHYLLRDTITSKTYHLVSAMRE